MEAEEAMEQFKKMKKEAEEVVTKVESFQQMAAKFVEDASATLNISLSKGEEYLAGVQKFMETPETQRNSLLKTLIQLMQEDLNWFRTERLRLAKMRAHYAEIIQLYN